MSQENLDGDVPKLEEEEPNQADAYPVEAKDEELGSKEEQISMGGFSVATNELKDLLEEGNSIHEDEDFVLDDRRGTQQSLPFTIVVDSKSDKKSVVDFEDTTSMSLDLESESRRSSTFKSKARLEHLDRKVPLITGDFKSKERIPASGDDFSLGSEFVEEEEKLEIEEAEIEEESVSSEETREESLIDRALYFGLYKLAFNQFNREKAANQYLRKKMIHYYTKRKMLHVFEKDEKELEAQKRYEKDLDKFSQLLESVENERNNTEDEIKNYTFKRRTKDVELMEKFEKLQRDEANIAKEIQSLCSTPNFDKNVERLIKRQRNQMAYIIKLRLTYIKLRLKLTEKQNEMKQLDHLGPGYHIMDYQQLRVDNRNYKDKLEERDLELAKLRQKCNNFMQVLAHWREKVGELDKSIDSYKSRLDELTTDFEDVRENLNYLNREKDQVRFEMAKVTEDWGLMSTYRILNDMSMSFEEATELKRQMSTLQAEVEAKEKSTSNLRRIVTELRQDAIDMKFCEKSLKSKGRSLRESQSWDSLGKKSLLKLPDIKVTKSLPTIPCREMNKTDKI